MVRDSYFIAIKLATDWTDHHLGGLSDFFFTSIHVPLLGAPTTTFAIVSRLPTRDVRVQADVLRRKARFRGGRPCS